VKSSVPDSFQNFGPDRAVQLFSVVFSWAVISPIAVVMAGRYLYRILGFEIPGSGDDYFWVPLWPIFRTKAAGSEVGFGFTVYLIVFFGIGFPFGPQIYLGVRERLGVDLGVWTSVSIVSAALVLTGTFAAFVFLESVSRRTESNLKRDDIIKRIGKERDNE
jgi:hypothetical protein